VAAFSSNDCDPFELNVKLLLAQYPLLQSLDTIPASHGEVHFRWNRPGILILPGTAGTWGVTLDLLTNSTRRRGSLVIHRLYHEQPLQLDGNLLISEFPVALASALDRVISRAVEMAPRTDQDEGMVEAQAG
jgi:hypothetical protein